MPLIFTLKCTLPDHRDVIKHVTTNPKEPNTIISASKDYTIKIWEINREQYSYRVKLTLTGHSQCVSDIAISNDGQYAISGSWDKTLRLWNLNNGQTIRSFVGHSDNVLSVAFSHKDRVILSASRDKTIKIWNEKGECKKTIDKAHRGSVKCVRFSSIADLIISCGKDKDVKIWNLPNYELRYFYRNEGNLNTIAISPKDSICANGGLGGRVVLWDILNYNYICTFECGDYINALAFSPVKFWICVATRYIIKIWDWKTRKMIGFLKTDDIKPESGYKKPLIFTCLTWSQDGKLLYVGLTDGAIRVYDVTSF